ncbi:MAG: DUF6265 family protein [Candidatus Eisenbacteria bacterium]
MIPVLLALPFLILASTVTSGGTAASSPFDMLGWLEGDWVRQTKRGLATESWTRVSANTMEGVAFVSVGEEIHVTEYLRLERLGEEVFYVAKPRENPFPTPFLLRECDEEHAVFENLNHDFPQRIIYTRNGDDGMTARIEGPGEGEVRAIDFRFERKK